MMGLETIRKEIARAAAGTRQAFRGVLGGLDRSKRVQLVTLEGLNGEPLQGTELFQHFGFRSAPPAGTQVIILPLGGKTSAAVIVATEHGNYSLQLGADGETAIYNQWGDHVWLKQSRVMELVAAVRVDITTPMVNMSGDCHVVGNITTDANIHASGSIVADQEIADQGGAKSMGGMRAIYNAHDHLNPEGGRVGHDQVQM